MEIISEKADCKSTLMGVISRLQKMFVEERGLKYVLVVGDAKTYNLLQSIRFEYQSCLKWMIPFPGDWHILYNYQKVLMKPYADAGLVTLGKVAGHRAETLTSLIQASNFRRTHEFLLQSCDAFYRYFLSLYTSHLQIEEKIDEIMSSLIKKFLSIKSESDLAKKYPTIHFWYQYVCVDCFAYIALFTSLRYRNWDLRTGSLKLLAAVFAGFDRPIYQELIPRHIKDLLTMPSSVLHHLRKGGFSVRLSASEWHGVGLDECHEMKINKDAKHPSKRNFCQII